MNWYYTIIVTGQAVYRKLGCHTEYEATREAQDMVSWFRGSTYYVGYHDVGRV